MRRDLPTRPLAACALAFACATAFDAAVAPPLFAEKVFTGPGLARREAQRGALNALDIQERVGFDQKLGATLPLDLPFRDEAGREVRLGDLFGKRPVLLAFVYHRCPVLCTQTSIGVAAAMKGIPYRAGEQFEVVFVSFDPTDTPELAAEKKAATVKRFGDESAAAGIHFLTGDEAAIARLTDAAGFRYAYDETTRQYAHSAGVVVATADGRTSRYLYGVELAPKDLKLALFEAGEGKIGGLSEKLMLLCFDYNAALGKYTAGTMLALKIAATITLAALAGSIFWMLRGERRRNRTLAGPGNPAQGVASV
jgi:protein SCO1/2